MDVPKEIESDLINLLVIKLDEVDESIFYLKQEIKDVARIQKGIRKLVNENLEHYHNKIKNEKKEI